MNAKERAVIVAAIYENETRDVGDAFSKAVESLLGPTCDPVKWRAVLDRYERTPTAEETAAELWSTLTPRALFAVLLAAPKVAGPWQLNADGEIDLLERVDHLGRPLAWQHGPDDWSVYDDGGEKMYATRAEADARLRELGWLLVDEGSAS